MKVYDFWWFGEDYVMFGGSKKGWTNSTKNVTRGPTNVVLVLIKDKYYGQI